MIKVVTFYTYGPPRDGAGFLEAQMMTLRRLVEEQGFRFSAYSPEDVRALGAPELVQAYPDEYRLERNPGGHAIGFFAWKPFIMIDAMKDMGEGDVLFYMDCNLAKWNQYHDKVRHIRDIVAIAQRIGDFFIGREHVGQDLIIRHFSSNNQMRIIGRDSEFCKNFPMLIVNNIVCRKSDSSLDVLKEWLKYCERPDCILPPVNGDHDPGFKWFVPEQAALTLLLARRVETGRLPWFYPGVCLGRGFNPQLTDNSHVKHLPLRPPAVLPDRTPVGGRGEAGAPQWRKLDVPLSAWEPADGGRATPQPNGEVLLGDGLEETFHLLRIRRREVDGAWIRLKVVARPLPECEVAFHFQHWGGLDVASFDREGRLIVHGIASHARAIPCPDGHWLYEVEFPNLHETLSFGLGNPWGQYKGRGLDHFAISDVSVEYAALGQS